MRRGTSGELFIRPLYMCSTCNYHNHMPKMIQLRHVPDPVHRKLKARAATKGMSLSDYLVAEVTELVAHPTLEEILDRIEKRGPIVPPESPTKLIRRERDARG